MLSRGALQRTISLPLISLIALIELFSVSAAFGWGLLTDLTQNWAGAPLAYSVLLKGSINYCIAIEDPRFRHDSIKTQIEMALGLWLRAAAGAGVGAVKLIESECSAGGFDLKIKLGRAEIVNAGAYRLGIQDHGRYYWLVAVDSNFLYPENGKTYPIVDFDTFLQPGQSLEETVNRISVDSPTTTQEFAKSLGKVHDAVFWSTYPIFIHEFGHVLGLCDTYAAQIKTQCDPKFMSADQPPSVMQTSTFFYLTDDDIAGVTALFNRYKDLWAAADRRAFRLNRFSNR
jgi:hypothetical protein